MQGGEEAGMSIMTVRVRDESSHGIKVYCVIVLGVGVLSGAFLYKREFQLNGSKNDQPKNNSK